MKLYVAGGYFQRVRRRYQSQSSHFIAETFARFPRCILRAVKWRFTARDFTLTSRTRLRCRDFTAGYHLGRRRYCRFSFADMIEHVPPGRISALKGYQGRMLRPLADNMIFMKFIAHRMPHLIFDVLAKSGNHYKRWHR